MKNLPKNINTILIIFVIVVGVCFFGVCKFVSKEAFQSSSMINDNLLHPGEYPNTQDKPLLSGYYNVKDNTGVTKNNNYNIWKEYPVYENSYDQETNNKQYWSTPDNGLCSPAEFCGTPYSPTNIKIDKASPGFPLGAPVTRVNWWASSSQ